MSELQSRLAVLREQAIKRRIEQPQQKAEYVDSLSQGLKVDIAYKDTYRLDMPWDAPITLPKTEPLFIGFDQSTTQTGIAVLNSKEQIICLIDFKNTTKMPEAMYKKYLKEFLERLFKNTTVALIVMETPWGGWKNAQKVLKALLDDLILLFKSMDETREVPIKTIYPNQWRNAYLISQNYKGRLTGSAVKQSAREETVLRYPQLKDFAYHHSATGEAKTSKVPDSLEALGVIKGYIEKNYTKDGKQVITKNIKKTSRVVIHQIVVLNLEKFVSEFTSKYNRKPSTQEMESAVLDKTINGVYSIAQQRGVTTMVYNKELTLADNIQLSGCETEKVIVSLINDQAVYSKLIWQQGRPLYRGEAFFFVAYRKNL